MDARFNNLSLSSEAGRIITNDEELRLVMVGKTGIGKSATGNTILGRKAFESKFCAQSITVLCKKGAGLVRGQKVAVIDTPGLFDTRYEKEKTAKDLGHCISFAAPGPHVFLVIISLGRFTDEEKKTVEMIQQVFGQAADQYSMVLFTGGDQLEGTIEDFLDGCPDLKQLVARCNNQYHVVNNKKTDDSSQVDELLQKIRKIVMKNGGSHYTNAMFQEAEREIEEEKQRILKEKEEEIRREKEEMKRKLQEKYDEQIKKKQEEMEALKEEERREMERKHKEEMEKECKLRQQQINEHHANLARIQAEKEKSRSRCIIL